jgi:glycosyltransferase involved in cell wall biosynthesis
MIKNIIITIQFVNLTSFVNKTMIEIYGIAFSIAELVLMAAFGVLLFIQLFYFVLKASFISGGKKKNPEISYPPVSIIVPSRNFEEELKVILPDLLTQDYPDFQVVVVNDCSSDGTEWYLSNLKLEYANLKTTHIIQETDFPNALALTLGIRAAACEWMIFLNPLCVIPGKNWLKNYVEHFTPEKEAVFGYVNFSASKGSMHQMIRLENFNSYILSGSARKLGLTMPVNDLNIAYKRTPFLDRKGFAAVLESPFCENELYLKEIATRRNSVYIMNNKASIGYADEFKWHDFVNFKKKQLLLKQKFTVGQRLYLWIETSSRIAFDILAIILVFLSQWRFWIIGIWLFKNTLELIWGIHAMRRLGEKKLFPRMGIFKTFAPIINSLVFFNQLFIGNKRRWK